MTSKKLSSALGATSFAAELARSFEPSRIHRELGLSRTMVSGLLETHRAFEPFNLPTSIGRTLDPFRDLKFNTGLSEQFAPLDWIRDVQKQKMGLTAVDFLSARALKNAGLSSTVIDQMSSIKRFDDLLGFRLPATEASLVSGLLRESLVPTLDILSRPWPTPIGVLSADPEENVATFSWLGGDVEAPRPRLAAVVELRSQKRRQEQAIEFEAEIFCIVCRAPIVSREQRMRWVGPRKEVPGIGVEPFCRPCLIRLATDPEAFAGLLDALLGESERPKYTLLKPHGETDGRARGDLRLVRKPDGDESEGDEDD